MIDPLICNLLLFPQPLEPNLNPKRESNPFPHAVRSNAQIWLAMQ